MIRNITVIITVKNTILIKTVTILGKNVGIT